MAHHYGTLRSGRKPGVTSSSTMPSTAPQAPQQHLQMGTEDLHNSVCLASHRPAAGVHQTITFVRSLPQVLALLGVPTRRSSHTPGSLAGRRTPPHHNFHPRPYRERTTTPRQQLHILPPVPSFPVTTIPPITASPHFLKNRNTPLLPAVPFPITSSSTATQTPPC